MTRAAMRPPACIYSPYASYFIFLDIGRPYQRPASPKCREKFLDDRREKKISRRTHARYAANAAFLGSRYAAFTSERSASGAMTARSARQRVVPHARRLRYRPAQRPRRQGSFALPPARAPRRRHGRAARMRAMPIDGAEDGAGALRRRGR